MAPMAEGDAEAGRVPVLEPKAPTVVPVPVTYGALDRERDVIEIEADAVVRPSMSEFDCVAVGVSDDDSERLRDDV
jgi:hypothetical protein